MSYLKRMLILLILTSMGAYFGIPWLIKDRIYTHTGIKVKSSLWWNPLTKSFYKLELSNALGIIYINNLSIKSSVFSPVDLSISRINVTYYQQDNLNTWFVMPLFIQGLTDQNLWNALDSSKENALGIKIKSVIMNDFRFNIKGEREPILVGNLHFNRSSKNQQLQVEGGVSTRSASFLLKGKYLKEQIKLTILSSGLLIDYDHDNISDILIDGSVKLQRLYGKQEDVLNLEGHIGLEFARGLNNPQLDNSRGEANINTQWKIPRRWNVVDSSQIRPQFFSLNNISLIVPKCNLSAQQGKLQLLQDPHKVSFKLSFATLELYKLLWEQLEIGFYITRKGIEVPSVRASLYGGDFQLTEPETREKHSKRRMVLKISHIKSKKLLEIIFPNIPVYLDGRLDFNATIQKDFFWKIKGNIGAYQNKAQILSFSKEGKKKWMKYTTIPINDQKDLIKQLMFSKAEFIINLSQKGLLQGKVEVSGLAKIKGKDVPISTHLNYRYPEKFLLVRDIFDGWYRLKHILEK